jgi:hypothetical protein
MSPASKKTNADISSLQAAVRRIAKNIPKMRERNTPVNETSTKSNLITPILEAMGWDIIDIHFEYRHVPQQNPVDYALFINKRPALFVEAKSLDLALDDEKWIAQATNYANAAGVAWCVLTNGLEWRIYKTHAPVAAPQKLFMKGRIDSRKTIPDTVRMLALLSQDSMRERVIDNLWQNGQIDNQVEATLREILEPQHLVKQIRKRLQHINVTDIQASLLRASLNVSWSQTVGAQTTSTDASARQSTASTKTATPRRARKSAEKNLHDRSGNTSNHVQRTKDLFNLGKLKVGDVLTLRGEPNSEARVVNGTHVNFKGQKMTFNAWGKQVKGWKSIQIYEHALLDNGMLLGTLRDKK